MRAHKPLHELLLLAAGITLLFPVAAYARRPIAPPGFKAPARPVEQPKSEEANGEENRTPSAEDTAPAAVEPPAQTESEQAPSASAEDGGSDDAAAEAAEPVEPEKPQILLPNDEVAAPRPVETKAEVPALAPSREVIYRKKLDKFSITLRVKPAKPLPGRSAALAFDIVRLLEVPDPSVGYRKPVEGGIFYATLSLNGESKGRFRLHPLKSTGSYGTHFTAPVAGVYRVQLEQVLEDPEIGEAGLSTEFLLGFGKDTPMEEAAEEEEEDMIQVRRSRRALRVVTAKDRNAPTDLMFELGEHWLALRSALESPQADAAEVAAHAEAIAELRSKLKSPASGAEDVEFEQLATGLDTVSEIPAKVAKPAAALEATDRTELGSCNRCHVRFRFHLTDDVSKWPDFSPNYSK